MLLVEELYKPILSEVLPLPTQPDEELLDVAARADFVVEPEEFLETEELDIKVLALLKVAAWE